MKVLGWQQERTALLVFIILAVISGLITGYWAWSLLFWLMLYGAWKALEFKTFYNWYMKGASKQSIPLNHGIFEAITCKVISNKNQTKEAHLRNKYLLKQFETTAQALPFATLLLNNRFEIQWANGIAQDILDVAEADVNVRIDNIIRAPEFVTLLQMQGDDEEIKLLNFKDQGTSIVLRLIKINSERYLLVARDISTQVALQNSRKAFVANASHELRTPLTVISGYLEMMQSSEQLKEEWTVAIDQAKEQANRMSKIIDDMLKLSRIEHDKVIPTKEVEIKMPELINGLYNDVRNHINSQQHHLSAEIDSSLRIRGNDSEITSVCLNLIHNAVIHTPIDTNIRVQWYENGSEAHFIVSDDGPGIAPEHLPHLTERFYRIDNSRARNHQSTGLGLAIVKHICIKHNAEFEIASDAESGTTFKVTFPASRTLSGD